MAPDFRAREPVRNDFSSSIEHLLDAAQRSAGESWATAEFVFEFDKCLVQEKCVQEHFHGLAVIRAERSGRGGREVTGEIMGADGVEPSLAPRFDKWQVLRVLPAECGMPGIVERAEHAGHVDEG